MLLIYSCFSTNQMCCFRDSSFSRRGVLYLTCVCLLYCCVVVQVLALASGILFDGVIQGTRHIYDNRYSYIDTHTDLGLYRRWARHCPLTNRVSFGVLGVFCVCSMCGLCVSRSLSRSLDLCVLSRHVGELCVCHSRIPRGLHPRTHRPPRKGPQHWKDI